ncbi:MAG: Flp family type IVb pilin [Rhodospirillaceae bacterium]
MFTTIKTLISDESGATAIEYGLIAALVSVAGIVALGAMGDSLETMFGQVGSELDDAVAAAQG